MDYTAQIQTAMQYIDDHWDEDLSVSDVAASVHMSPFHFHRVFSAMVGVSVMHFVRFRRLERAAHALRTSERSIADIALECQFESQATFTRAFVRYLGVPPGRYRRGAIGKGNGFPPHAIALLGKEDAGMSQVVSGPDYEFVGLMLENLDTVKDNSRAIVGLWGELHQGVLLPGEEPPTFGVCFPGPGTTFSYMAAVERKSLSDAPSGTVSRHVKAHEYAVFSHDEAAGAITEAFQHIWSTGLPATGRDYDEGAPDLEVYPGGAFGKEVVLEIWIPVK